MPFPEPESMRRNRAQVRRNQLERQFRPALAHAHKRDPRRPALGEEAEHCDRLDAACIAALALDCDSKSLLECGLLSPHMW